MFASKKMMAGLMAGGLLAVGSVGWAPTAMAAPGVDFSTESKIWMEGNSTLHPYKSTAKSWTIKATVAPGSNAKIGDVTQLDVTIPVKSLKSGDGALDNNMYNAMSADKHPTIRFVLTNAKVTNADGGDIEVVADGKLTISGTERTTKISAKGELKGDTIKIKGTKDMKMSEFGVKPPVLMFGAIKVDDKITVKYELVGKVTD
jgi:polyisoprenoid-binding protein YceI